ncbi:hypothetical protein DSECCO2_511300 [anaerobic digester metagenome]
MGLPSGLLHQVQTHSKVSELLVRVVVSKVPQVLAIGVVVPRSGDQEASLPSSFDTHRYKRKIEDGQMVHIGQHMLAHHLVLLIHPHRLGPKPVAGILQIAGGKATAINIIDARTGFPNLIPAVVAIFDEAFSIGQDARLRTNVVTHI